MIKNKSCGWVNCFAVSVKCRWSGGASDLVAMPAVKNERCPCALTDSDEMDGPMAIALLSITPSIPSEFWFARWNEMQTLMENPDHIIDSKNQISWWWETGKRTASQSSKTCFSLQRIFQFGLLSLLSLLAVPVRWKRHPLRRAAKLSQRRHMSHPLDQFKILNVGHPFNVS